MTETVRNLFSMACPACGTDERIVLVITSFAVLSPDGTDPFGDHEWDENSSCQCTACNHAGKVKDFRINKEENNSPIR